MADTLLCAACGSANEAGRKFCGECGRSLAQTCSKPPSSVAGIAYPRAKAAALRGEEPEFGRAVALLRESDRRTTLAMALVKQAEWLVSRGRPDEAEPLLAEAREFFEQLRARPWLQRLDAISSRIRDPDKVPA